MKCFPALFGLFLTLTAAQADSIALRNGTVFEGKYLSQNGQTVSFEANGKNYTVPRGEIQSIVLERNGQTEVMPGFGTPQGPDWQYVPGGTYVQGEGEVPSGGTYVRNQTRIHPHRYRQDRYDREGVNNQPQLGRPDGPAPMDIDGPDGRPDGPAPMDIDAPEGNGPAGPAPMDIDN